MSRFPDAPARAGGLGIQNETAGEVPGMSNELRTWFISGCSSGFGQALARAALSHGHRVAATARRVESLAGLRRDFGDAVVALEMDVTSDGSVGTAVAEAERALGRLEVVVNNAGFGVVGSVEETPDELVRQNFEVNFFGALRVIRAVLPGLRARGAGHIVNVSAAAAIGNYAGFGAYGASKCALAGLSESLELELAPLGVRVMLVEPGPFRTDFIGRSMRSVEPGAAYAGTVGKFAGFLRSMDGKQPGNPARGAEEIIRAVGAERSPSRLVLGKYAVEKVKRQAERRARELSAWESAGVAADGF